MRLALLFLALIGVTTIQAQSTYRTQSAAGAATYMVGHEEGPLMIVPVKREMYNSHFDEQMVEATGLSYEQLRDTLREGLSLAILNAMGDTLDGVTFVHQGVYAPDLDKLYDQIKYTYVPLPIDEEEELTQVDKWKSKLKKKEEEPERTGTFIKDGQLVTVHDNLVKYTNAQLKETGVLMVQNRARGVELFVLINQVDHVIPADADPIKLQNGTYSRRYKVHYTVIDSNGNQKAGGLAIGEYPASSPSDVDAIFEQVFPVVADQISKDLRKL